MAISIYRNELPPDKMAISFTNQIREESRGSESHLITATDKDIIYCVDSNIVRLMTMFRMHSVIPETQCYVCRFKAMGFGKVQ